MSPRGERVPSPDGRTRALCLFLLAFPIPLCALIYATRTVPRAGYVGIEGFTYRSDATNALMGLVALVAAVVLLAPRKGRRAAPSRAGTALLLAFVGFAGVLYFYGSRLGKTHYPWFHDSYHYLLGAKYFPEVGYSGLYGCHLVADAERPVPRYAPGDTVTDLAVDRPSTAAAVRAAADCSAFTPARWAEFQRDTTFFDTVARKDILRDRGYNGTPFHTVVVRALFGRWDIGYETMVALTFVDIALISVLLAAVTWAFGWRIGAIFAVFFFTNFADRFNFVGASCFRYAWIACLGVGVALLEKGRTASSAVLVSTAAMLSAFPALFLSGIGLKAASDAISAGRIAPRHARFLTAAALSALAFFGLSLMQPHALRSYGDFLSVMKIHSQADSDLRVGFRYDFLVRAEAPPEDSPYDAEQTAAAFRAVRVPYYLLACAALGFGLLLARRLDDVSATVLCGFLPFFLLVTAATYYYALTALLLLLWHESPEQVGDRFSGLLLVLTAAIYALWYVTDNSRSFLNNTAMSLAITVYLACILGFLARRHRRDLLRPRASGV
jgi:hypothetical protein